MSPPMGRVDDIEDLIAGYSNGDIDKPSCEERDVVIVPRLRLNSKRQESRVSELADLDVQSFVPGTHKVYVKTWGCAHNSSDSEYMCGLLSQQGYVLTEDKEEADLWLLNSCTVKSPAEDHFRNEVEAAVKAGRKVVAAGCVGQGKPSSDYLAGLSIIGVQQIDRVCEVVEETLKGNQVRLLGQRKVAGKKVGGASLALPKVRRNPLIEIIAISTGCLNQCTYCKTRHARGELGSYPPEEIVARARQSFEEGVVEIWLTSEDTGAYGRDIGVTLPELLWQLVEVVPKGCRMRLGMTNPPYIMDHLDEMAKILNHPRVYAFLHVPVQSGSDAVLRDMKREYNVDEFSRVVNILRKKVPGVTIITDIICGFPTETEDDFNETMILCRKYKFPSLFINQFFPRPGTPAARMKRVQTQEVKRRTRTLSDFFLSYQPYADRVGLRYSVLVTETSHDEKYYVGHNRFYEQVLLPKDPELMGRVVEVVIVGASKFSMTGELVAEEKEEEETVTALELVEATTTTVMNKKSRSKKSREGSGDTNWVYQGSVVILAMAILVRLVQLVYLTNNGAKDETKIKQHYGS